MYNFFWTARLCQDLRLLSSLLANYHDSTLQLKNSLCFFFKCKKNPDDQQRFIENPLTMVELTVSTTPTQFTADDLWVLTLSVMYVYWQLAH